MSKVVAIIWAILVFSSYQHVLAQSASVSPKLDFDDTENRDNSTIPVVPGVGQGRTDERRDGDTSGNSGGTGGGSSTKTGPKIHGVRVTVDTGNNQKSKESTESVEVTEGGGKHTKRVGIHTDITFEISADGIDATNTTTTTHGTDEDASVPIYRGRGGASNKPRKSYDPKNNWNPNFSHERREYDSTGRAVNPSYGGYYPQHPQNVPIYVGNDESRSGGNNYRKGWNSYVPRTSVWTTERYQGDVYQPNTVNGYRAPSWKPCYCVSSGENRRRRDNQHGTGVLRPTSSVIELVDGKLERPFSRK